MSKKTAVLFVRMTHDEAQEVKAKAALAGLKSVSDYSRQALKKSTVKQSANKDFLKSLSELSRIGTNLNQIAYAINTIKKSADKTSFDFSIIEREIVAIQDHLSALKGEVLK